MNLGPKQPLRLGSTIGILGDGQLGRMLCLAAHRLGFQTMVMGDNPEGPAAQVTNRFLKASFDDEAALEKLKGVCDAITFEWENIPTNALEFLINKGAILAPSPDALKITQDRWLEKNFVSGLGFKTASTILFDEKCLYTDIVNSIGIPAIIKTRTEGYDGKGQVVIRSEDDWDAAVTLRAQNACVAEGVVDFKRELSIIGARGWDGVVQIFAPAENVHKNGILHTSLAPAALGTEALAGLEDMMCRVLTALGYIGVLAIELFETHDGQFLVNELAPRVHNSGHWTQDGGGTDQFEQHIRAIAGWPLGEGMAARRILMTNLIGGDIDLVHSLCKDPLNRLHLYGKSEARSGRKMGHINRVLS
jgi:5-(carboxyamino)imidazole ribonucleotide synthase